MKHKKLIVIAILGISLCGGGAFVYYKKNSNKSQQSQAQTPNSQNSGTTIKYEDGKLSTATLNDDYRNKSFPDLRIPVEGTTFEVTQNDRNQEGIVNFTATLKKDPINLTLTAFTDNGGRSAGSSCFENGDYQDIGNGWYREKMKSQTGTHLGYYFVKNPNYVKSDSDQFNSIYRKYKQFKEDNKQEVLSKEKAISCDSYIHRVSETKTTLKQKNNSDKVFIRFMVDKVISGDDLNQIDKLISKTKI